LSGASLSLSRAIKPSLRATEKFKKHFESFQMLVLGEFRTAQDATDTDADGLQNMPRIGKVRK